MSIKRDAFPTDQISRVLGSVGEKILKVLVFSLLLWYNETNESKIFSHSTKRLSPLNSWYVYFFPTFCYDECERRKEIEWIRSKSVNSFHNNEKTKI